MNDPQTANVTSFKDRVRSLVALLEGGTAIEGDHRKDLQQIDPFQLERMEEELLDEGFTREDIIRLCDEWCEMVIGTSGSDEGPFERTGHPLEALSEEHRTILILMLAVRDQARQLREGEGPAGTNVPFEMIETLQTALRGHMMKEEEVLFPYLEGHGVEGPPAMIWSEHEVLRANEQELSSLIGRERFTERNEFVLAFEHHASVLLSLLCAHFHKEDEDFFPLAERVLDIHELDQVLERFGKAGDDGE